MRQPFYSEPQTTNPLDAVEDIVAECNWAFERRNSEELVIEVPGRWCDFGVFVAWTPQLNALHISCVMDLKLRGRKRAEVNELLACANERLWIGHFSLWTDDNMPLFRHTLLMDNPGQISNSGLSKIIRIALNECDRFYPAFQYVVWGGHSPAEALEAALLDTVGEA